MREQDTQRSTKMPRSGSSWLAGNSLSIGRDVAQAYPDASDGLSQRSASRAPARSTHPLAPTAGTSNYGGPPKTNYSASTLDGLRILVENSSAYEGNPVVLVDRRPHISRPSIVSVCVC